MNNEEKELTKKVKYDIQYAKKHIKRVPLDMQIEAYKELQAAADRAGEKINTYIKNAITQRMEREQTTANAEPERWPPSTNDVVRRLSTLPIAEQKRIQSLPSSEQYRALGFIPPMG